MLYITFFGPCLYYKKYKSNILCVYFWSYVSRFWMAPFPPFLFLLIFQDFWIKGMKEWLNMTMKNNHSLSSCMMKDNQKEWDACNKKRSLYLNSDDTVGTTLWHDEREPNLKEILHRNGIWGLEAIFMNFYLLFSKKSVSVARERKITKHHFRNWNHWTNFFKNKLKHFI